MSSSHTEQVFHDLEQRHLLLRREHESLKVERDSLKGKTNNFEQIVTELRGSLEVAHRDVSLKEVEIKQCELANKTLTQSLEDANERLRRRSEECDRLVEDVKRQGEELVSLQVKLRGSQTALSEAQSQALPLQYSLVKLERENALLKARAVELEKEDEAKLDSLRLAQRASSDKIFELESQVISVTSERDELKSRVKSLQDRNSLLDEKVTDYAGKLMAAEAQSATQHATFSQELDGVRKMADLYKRHFDDAALRVEALEQSVHEGNEKLVRQRQQLRDAAQHEVQAAREVLGRDVESLRTRVAELESQLREAEETLAVSSPVPSTALTLGAPVTSPGDAGGSIQVYSRMAAAEKALLAEKGRTRELELYVNRLVKEVESKVPLLAAQRRDHARLVHSHTQLITRLDELAVESAGYKESLRVAESRAAAAEQEALVVRQHNADLGAQLQHLLKKNHELEYGGTLAKSQHQLIASSSHSPDDLISTHLVTFDDVKDLQQKNAHLLQIIRKLSNEQEVELSKQQSVHKIDAEVEEDLQAALTELASMREDRKRTESLMLDLVHQRDIYKAMLDETDSTLATTRLQITNGTQVDSPSGRSGSQATTLSLPVASPASQLQTKLAELEEEKRMLSDRVSRMEEASKLINEALDKAKQENIGLRLEASKANSELQFQSERARRLDDALRDAQLENTAATQRRLDSEKLLVETQRECRARDDKVLQSETARRTVESALNRAQIDLEVSRAAEERLQAQLSEQREEVKRQMSLAESIHRIEAGLSSRAEEANSSLARERDTLHKSLENLKKELEHRDLLNTQRIRVLEDELRSAVSKADNKVAEASSLREDLIREQGVSKAAQERGNILERQLAITQEHMTAAQSAQVLSTLASSEQAERDIAIERAAAEVESLRSQLAMAEKHSEEYRQIGAATESALKELRERSDAARLAFDAELERLRTQASDMLAEQSAQKLSANLLLKDAEDAREQLRAAAAAHSLKEQELEARILAQNAQLQQMAAQAESLKSDVSKFHDASRQSFANYERELQLHAEAEKARKSLQDELEQVKSALSVEKQNSAESSAAAIRREAAAKDERAKLETAVSDAKADADSLRRSNELLHGQLQSLGTQVDRLLASRESVSSVPASSESLIGAVDSVSITDELAELRRSSTELREVMRYMKRERDLLEAKLGVSETEASRHLSGLAVVQRSLDETRAELKKELEKRSSLHTDDEFQRLMGEVTQLNLLRESNAHLRAENEELARRANKLADDLSAEKTSNAPVQESMRRLQSEKQALELSNESLLADANYWRDRLNQLVSRYNDVDPEEHRLLQLNFDNAVKEKTELQASLNEITSKLVREASEYTAKIGRLEEIIKDKDALASAKQAENDTLQSRYDNLEKNAEQLREKFREFKTKVTESMKKNSDKVSELTKANQSLTAQLESSLVALEKAKEERDSAVATAKEAPTAAAQGSTLQATAAVFTPASSSTAAPAAFFASRAEASSSTSSAGFTPAPTAVAVPSVSGSVSLVGSTPASSNSSISISVEPATIAQQAGEPQATIQTQTDTEKEKEKEAQEKRVKDLLLLHRKAKATSATAASATTSSLDTVDKDTGGAATKRARIELPPSSSALNSSATAAADGSATETVETQKNDLGMEVTSSTPAMMVSVPELAPSTYSDNVTTVTESESAAMEAENGLEEGEAAEDDLEEEEQIMPSSTEVEQLQVASLSSSESSSAVVEVSTPATAAAAALAPKPVSLGLSFGQRSSASNTNINPFALTGASASTAAKSLLTPNIGSGSSPFGIAGGLGAGIASFFKAAPSSGASTLFGQAKRPSFLATSSITVTTAVSATTPQTTGPVISGAPDSSANMVPVSQASSAVDQVSEEIITGASNLPASGAGDERIASSEQQPQPQQQEKLSEEADVEPSSLSAATMIPAAGAVKLTTVKTISAEEQLKRRQAKFAAAGASAGALAPAASSAAAEVSVSSPAEVPKKRKLTQQQALQQQQLLKKRLLAAQAAAAATDSATGMRSDVATGSASSGSSSSSGAGEMQQQPAAPDTPEAEK